MKEHPVAFFPYWSSTPEGAVEHMGSTSTVGLTTDVVEQQRKQFGVNEMKDTNKNGRWRMLVRQFSSPLIFILIIATAATLFLEEWIDAAVIFLAIAVNAGLGYFQESKAEQAIEHLRSFITVRTRVIRDGRETEIDALDVVPGDIVHLTLGSRVPADGRLLRVQNLRIDEAILTGESLPVAKHTKVLKEETTLPERLNMVFGGTLVTEGNGHFVVTAIGMQTEFGKIADLVGATNREHTPLQVAVAKLAWVITVGVSLFVTGVFALGVYRGEPIFDMFLVSIAVAVGAIPEALPIGLTAVLAVGVERLAKRKGVMRNLTAAETLGSTTVVMTDKTGTLTESRLQLVGILSAESLMKGQAHADHHEVVRLSAKQKDLLALAAACTDVAVENPTEPVAMWRIAGNPLEAAILKTAALHKIAVAHNPSDRVFRQVLPFSSTHKFSVSEGMVGVESGILSKEKGYAQVVLGAPDVLLNRAQLSKEAYLTLSAAITKQSEEGKRLIGVGVRFIHSAGQTHGNVHPDAVQDIEFVGVLTFFDPVRPEVPEAIKRIEAFGVRVVMATGDLPGTALAVGRDLGWEIDDSQVLSGEALAQLSDEELSDALEYVRVFARVTPRDKLRVAQLYQRRGEIVAMTGDGVNDAPSLKAVNIGIAVGSGSDVAKGVADLVLLDDNFNTIVAAIEEGKRVLRNIQKTFVYLMSNSLDEVILIGGSLLLALPLPLTAIQIIWVNFATGSLPAIAFAFDTDVVADDGGEKVDKRIINRSVRVLTLAIGLLIAPLLFALYYVLLQFSFDELEVRTFIFVCFSSYILFVAFSLRSLERSILEYNPFSNHFLNAGVLIGIVLLACTVYVPFLQPIFSTTTLSVGWLALLILWLVFTVVLVECIKRIFRVQ
jgi:P-type Ca2+ transporter type 2C